MCVCCARCVCCVSFFVEIKEVKEKMSDVIIKSEDLRLCT